MQRLTFDGLRSSPQNGKPWSRRLTSQAHLVVNYSRPEVTMLVFLFKFLGVKATSADGGLGVKIQSKASWRMAIAKHYGRHS